MHVICVALAAFAAMGDVAAASPAYTLRHRASVYEDNQGASRQRQKLDLGFEAAHAAMITKSIYSLSASRDVLKKKDLSEDVFMEKYHGRERTTDTFALGFGQSWRRLTDTRQFAQYSSDSVSEARSGGIGLSHWFWQETLQLGVDYSRTLVKQPQFEVLGADSDIIAPPPLLTSSGVMLSAKHLATPTTITSFGYTHVETNSRPPANVYTGGIKQFIPQSKSAVHLDFARAFNQGRITSKTTYGEVNAWIAEIAFLQSLWIGAHSRIAYRFYKEDETTRVEQKEYVRGSDLVTLSFAQELTRKDIDALRFPLKLEFTGGRYHTNELDNGRKLVANIFEFGASSKF